LEIVDGMLTTALAVMDQTKKTIRILSRSMRLMTVLKGLIGPWLGGSGFIAGWRAMMESFIISKTAPVLRSSGCYYSTNVCISSDPEWRGDVAVGDEKCQLV